MASARLDAKACCRVRGSERICLQDKLDRCLHVIDIAIAFVNMAIIDVVIETIIKIQAAVSTHIKSS